MRKFTRFVLPAVFAITLLTLANTAQAGEPLHPIYQPVFNFFSWILGGF